MDGTDTGDFSEMRRLYIQDGKIVHSPPSTILGPGKESDSITDQFCDDKKDLFGDVKDYQEHGGMKGMGESLDRGHVMIFSLWDDVEVNMLWLDSAYPLNKPDTDPGIKRGDCPGGGESTPTYLRETFPNVYVTFKNAAVGEIGSTAGPINPPTPSPTPSPIQSNNPTTKSPTSSEGCYSNDYKHCFPNGYDLTNCDTIWLPNGSQGNCVALWGDCTSDASSCCGPAECFGSITKSCVPPFTETSIPTTSPTIFQMTSPPSEGCSAKGEPCEINADCCMKKCKKKTGVCRK